MIPMNPVRPPAAGGRTPRGAAVAMALMLAGLAGTAQARDVAPYVPARDSDVVERLPTRLATPDAVRLERQQRQMQRANPQLLPLALARARAAIERARRLGDPRELGQAQAALAPWWAEAEPQPPVQLLRAIIRQSQHDFEPALKDLEALLQPARAVPLGVRAQAELTRASVLQVRGRWAEAAQACERLTGETYAALGAGLRLPAEVCRAELLGLHGADAQSDTLLRRLAREAAGTPDAAWVALVRAERAARRDDPAAGPLFREALAGRDDVYTLAAYADWLLDQNQPQQVQRLLADRADADALLLRLAMAWQRTGDPRAAEATATLAERFDAALRRGDTTHAREQALHALVLRQDAAAALKFAERNWAAQKEPADGLLLLRAAQAAGQPDAAEPVRRFAADQGWQDARLRRALPGTALTQVPSRRPA